MTWTCIRCEATNDNDDRKCIVCSTERHYSHSEILNLLRRKEFAVHSSSKNQGALVRSKERAFSLKSIFLSIIALAIVLPLMILVFIAYQNQLVRKIEVVTGSPRIISAEEKERLEALKKKAEEEKLARAKAEQEKLARAKVEQEKLARAKLALKSNEERLLLRQRQLVNDVSTWIDISSRKIRSRGNNQNDGLIEWANKMIKALTTESYIHSKILQGSIREGLTFTFMFNNYRAAIRASAGANFRSLNDYGEEGNCGILDIGSGSINSIKKVPGNAYDTGLFKPERGRIYCYGDTRTKCFVLFKITSINKNHFSFEYKTLQWSK